MLALVTLGESAEGAALEALVAVNGAQQHLLREVKRGMSECAGQVEHAESVTHHAPARRTDNQRKRV
jgi:hypothetical protein